MAINRPSSGAGIWCPSCQDWAFGTPLPRTGDLVPPVRFRPRIMANLEVWYPDFCQLRRFGSSHPEKCLVAICLSGFCGYKTLRFARRRVPNLKIRPTAGIKLEISPRKGTKPRDPAEKTALRGTKPPKLAEARQPAWQKAHAKPLILQKLNILYLAILQKRNLLSYTALQKPHYCR